MELKEEEEMVWIAEEEESTYVGPDDMSDTLQGGSDISSFLGHWKRKRSE